MVGVVEARTLESSELLVGEWEVTVRVRGGRLSSSSKSKARATSCSGIDALFPPRRSIVRRGVGEQGKRDDVTSDRPRPRKKWYSCRLAVFANRTFVLRPEEDSGLHNGIQEPGDDNRLLPVRGKWSILSNPYCVTDRFYDNLHLVSYPRVQTQQRILVSRSGTAHGGLSSSSERSDMVVSSDPLRRVHLEFHGHVRGHHTAGGWVRRIVGPDRYHRGRIRNGVVLLSDAAEDGEGHGSSNRVGQERRSWSPPWPLGRRRKLVIATFTAKRRMLPFRQLIQELDDDHLKNFEIYGNK